ncbi:MAG: antibiotic biosynthesis monooxygenase [Nitrososphaerota archaeon]|nr:antibiotic biosynthesis monooxygenase [Nitrososphaerota archaeon]MDG6955484.1 antibiotic biosynthesis monooxygenase [Nitrososphaerota archaeon]
MPGKLDAGRGPKRTVKTIASEDGGVPSIARVWHGVTPKTKRSEFIHYVGVTSMMEIRKTKGNRGAWLFTRDVGDNTEFLLVSLWDSEESIRRFAGTDIRKAKYFRRDSEYLAELEPSVTHFEVSGKV